MMSGEIERHGSPRVPDAVPGGAGQRRGTPGYAPRRAGELDPEWAMVGVDVPAGKRLYASRHLKGTAFEVAVDAHMNGEGWHLATVMQRMLVITRPTYSECLAELTRIWQNWENEGRELPAGAGDDRALA